MNNDGIDFQEAPTSVPSNDGIDFKEESHPIKDFVSNVGKTWENVKSSPAYSTSPQGLLESGFDLANKGASKLGDIAEKGTDIGKFHVPGITEGPSGVDPITGKAINKFISAGPMLASFAMPTESSKLLEEAAKTKGLQSTGIGQKFLAAMKPEEFEASKNFVAENNLIGTGKEEVLQKALAKQKELGNALGEIGKKTESIGIKADYSDWEKAVGKLQDKLAGTSDVEYKAIKDLAPRYQEAMDDVTNALSKDSSWTSIQKLKQKFGEIAFDVTGEIKDKPAADTYFALRDMLMDVTKKAQSDPNLPEAYKKALSGYHTIDPVIESLQKAVGAERAGVAGHGAGHGFLSRIIQSLPGQHNPAINLGTAALATAISPHLGPVMALPTLTNPAIQSKVFSGMSKAVPATAKAIPTINQLVSDYLSKKFANKK